MAAFMLQMVNSIPCSDTNTHLLPRIRLSVISGVSAATSSSVIKLDPAPFSIWLKATTRMVYHRNPKAIKPSSSSRPLNPTRWILPTLYDEGQEIIATEGVNFWASTHILKATKKAPTPYKLQDSGTKPGFGFT